MVESHTSQTEIQEFQEIKKNHVSFPEMSFKNFKKIESQDNVIVFRFKNFKNFEIQDNVPDFSFKNFKNFEIQDSNVFSS